MLIRKRWKICAAARKIRFLRRFHRNNGAWFEQSVAKARRKTELHCDQKTCTGATCSKIIEDSLSGEVCAYSKSYRASRILRRDFYLVISLQSRLRKGTAILLLRDLPSPLSPMLSIPAHPSPRYECLHHVLLAQNTVHCLQIRIFR